MRGTIGPALLAIAVLVAGCASPGDGPAETPSDSAGRPVTQGVDAPVPAADAARWTLVHEEETLVGGFSFGAGPPEAHPQELQWLSQPNGTMLGIQVTGDAPMALEVSIACISPGCDRAGPQTWNVSGPFSVGLEDMMVPPGSTMQLQVLAPDWAQAMARMGALKVKFHEHYAEVPPMPLVNIEETVEGVSGFCLVGEGGGGCTAPPGIHSALVMHQGVFGLTAEVRWDGPPGESGSIGLWCTTDGPATQRPCTFVDGDLTGPSPLLVEVPEAAWPPGELKLVLHLGVEDQAGVEYEVLARFQSPA